MTCFNTLRNWRSPQPIDANSDVQLISADDKPTCGQQFVRAVRWIVLLPVNLPSALIATVLKGAQIGYSTLSLFRNQNLLTPIQNQIIPNRAVQLIPFPRVGNQHVVISSKIAGLLLKDARNSQDGLFSIPEDWETPKYFLPILRDLFGGSPTLEDFLLTASKDVAGVYRKAILDFLGPRNHQILSDNLSQVAASTLLYLKSLEVDGTFKMTAKELTGTFTVAVISFLLLGKEGKFKDYAKLHHAITLCIEFPIKCQHQKPTQQETKEHTAALTLLRETIIASEGPFTQSLKETSLTDLQRKGLLFLLYVAGGETASSLLDFILYHLGINPDFQEKILKDKEFLAGVIQEGLRLQAPSTFIARTPRQDLELRVTTGNTHWTYSFSKGEVILISPYLMARDPSLYENPDAFDPLRKWEASPSWFPFGKGFHTCPGKWLALGEVEKLLLSLLTHYTISADAAHPPAQKSIFTTHYSPSPTLTFTRRGDDDIVIIKDDGKE